MSATNDEPRGWVCPKCGAVYAPWVYQCKKCHGASASANVPVPRLPWGRNTAG